MSPPSISHFAPFLAQLIPWLVAFAVSAAGVAVLTPIALRLGAVSEARPDRWLARPAIPRFAGPALFLAVAPWCAPGHVLILLLFGAIGVTDDLFRLSPARKILLLLPAALVAASVTGSPLIGLACVVAATSLNLLDHADGLAGTVAMVSLGVAGGPVGMAGAGASAGFLLHNRPPARVFMGDGGSHLLGALLVLAWKDKGLGYVVAGCAVPLLDSGFVTFCRIIRGCPPWQGGTDHTGHLLLRAGIRPWGLLALYAGVTLVAAVAGRRLAGG